MDITVKAFLARTDGSTEVRRLPLSVGGPKDVSGLFEILKGQMAASFPCLKGKHFIMSWRDSDGDYVLMSSDEELLEALSEMDGRQLKVFITETPEEVQTYEQAAMFPAKSRNSKPRGPWMRVTEEEAFDRSVKDDKGWKTALRDLVPTAHRRWAKDFIRQWRQLNLLNDSVTGSSEPERGPKLTQEEAGVPPAYVTYVEVMTLRFHKTWAQEKVGKPAAEFDDAKKVVPQPFQNWVRWYLKTTFGPNRTPRFKQDKKKMAQKKDDKTKEANKDEVKEFTAQKTEEKAVTKDQKKKKSSSSSSSSSDDDKDKEGKKEKKAWKKEWKGRRKQIKEEVKKEHRKWSEAYIRKWRSEHLTPEEQGRYLMDSSSESSSESEGEEQKRQRKDRDILAKGDVPQDYPRYLDLFLTQWHANQGDKLKGMKVKEAPAALKQITDAQVPPAYRKWVTFYAIRVLGRKKIDKRQEEEVNAWRQYNTWMIVFQKRWVAGLVSDGGSSSEDDTKDAKPPTGKITAASSVIERLQNIIDSEAEYENELFVPPQRKPPAEFRYWAAPILSQWDCKTIGYGLEPDVYASLSNIRENDDVDLPPNVLSWMKKTMARFQLKRLRVELREAQKTDTSQERKKCDTKECGATVRSKEETKVKGKDGDKTGKDELKKEERRDVKKGLDGDKKDADKKKTEGKKEIKGKENQSKETRRGEEKKAK